MHPAGRQGAVSAMQDAIVLANWLNVRSFGSRVEEVKKCFKEYQDE